MLKKTWWLIPVLLLLFCLTAAISSAREEKITVYNPIGIKPPIRLIPMPERGSIDGKTVYIVDIKYANTKPFINELFKILKERYPKTNWVLREKVGMYMDDDPKLWAEIKEKAAGMIMAIGH